MIDGFEVQEGSALRRVTFKYRVTDVTWLSFWWTRLRIRMFVKINIFRLIVARLSVVFRCLLRSRLRDVLSRNPVKPIKSVALYRLLLGALLQTTGYGRVTASVMYQFYGRRGRRVSPTLVTVSFCYIMTACSQDSEAFDCLDMS